MKNAFITGITVLLVASCGGLDNNPFDEKSKNHTSTDALRSYAGDTGVGGTVYIRDTLRIRDSIFVGDSVFYVYVKDSVYIRDSVYFKDTIRVKDTVYVSDGTIIYVHDTTKITDTLRIKDTLRIRDTLRIKDTVKVQVRDTVKITVSPSIQESAPTVINMFTSVLYAETETEFLISLDKCQKFAIRIRLNQLDYDGYELEGPDKTFDRVLFSTSVYSREQTWYTYEARCISPEISQWSSMITTVIWPVE